MRLLRDSITLKLLTLILPLVLTPILLVGFLSYYASVNSVTRLSRDYQILQAKSAAAEIDAIFNSCRKDLAIIAGFVIENANALHALGNSISNTGKNLAGLLHDFVDRSAYYLQIRITDYNGVEICRVRHEGFDLDSGITKGSELNWNMEAGTGKLFHISGITKVAGDAGYLISLSQLIVLPGTDVLGTVSIDLAYDKIINLVSDIRIGDQGYGFLVDAAGRTIAHPDFKPYEYDLTRYDDPRLREFVISMISGETGWMTFNEQGEKAAAFSPVSSTGWSLAVSVPIDEYKREAKGLRNVVLQVVLVTFVVIGLVVIFVSHRFNRPVRELVLATGQIASGDLSRQIPVKSGDELGLLTLSFNRMIQSLRDSQSELIKTEKLAAMGRLSAGVAHEIRNPLNAMKGAISYLQRRRKDDGLVIEYTDLILEEINRLGEFVSEFLLFARQSEPKRVTTDINEIIQNVLNLYEVTFREHAIDFRLRTEGALPKIKIDPQQFEQVFVNLFNNALHAMPQGGELIVRSRFVSDSGAVENASKIIVEVTDNGSGIPEDKIRHIFDPFFSTKESGTGLGLPISLGIVEAHGGLLTVTSTSGERTDVVIELPID